jgi:hypothetical protein
MRYEDAVVDPEATFERLARRLDLTDLEAMRAKLRRPSQSSSRSTAETRDAIEKGRGADAVERWRDQVDAAEIGRCEEIVTDLGLDLAIVERSQKL